MRSSGARRRWLFLRHGVAEDGGAGHPDALRRLTPEGAAEMVAAGRGMRALGIQPDVILASPLDRARDTARLVAEQLDLLDILREDDRIPGCGIGDLQDLAAEHPHAKQLLVVGHEPDMSFLVGTLIGRGQVRMGKGSLACVDGVPEPGGGELRWLLTASQLGRAR